MSITKFGHCCLLVRENGVGILIDPGTFSTGQNEQTDVDVVLITHEHPDHFHLDSVKMVLEHNPNARIITNTSVGGLLEKENIPFTCLENGQQIVEKGIEIKGFGTTHACMHSSIPLIQNTGYLIAGRLFYPGDSFVKPDVPVEVLALPVAGPWMRLMEAIDYALELKPRMCFPVHEGILKTPGSTHLIPPKVLEPQGIPFTILDLEKEYEF